MERERWRESGLPPSGSFSFSWPHRQKDNYTPYDVKAVTNLKIDFQRTKKKTRHGRYHNWSKVFAFFLESAFFFLPQVVRDGTWVRGELRCPNFPSFSRWGFSLKAKVLWIIPRGSTKGGERHLIASHWPLTCLTCWLLPAKELTWQNFNLSSRRPGWDGRQSCFACCYALASCTSFIQLLSWVPQVRLLPQTVSTSPVATAKSG